MGKQYTEIVMVGPLRLIKGFVHGYFLGKGDLRRPFFHLKTGTIRRDTLLGSLRTFFEMENKIPFCLETSNLYDFENAVEIAKERFGIYIKEKKAILSAEFQFEHRILNRQLAGLCKDIFTLIPEGIEIFDYIPVEEDRSDYPALTFKGSAPRYCYLGEGMVYGDFEPVIKFYMNIMGARCSEFFNCHDLKLNLEEKEE